VPINSHHALAEVLLKIEAEMRECSLWSSETPTDEALKSIHPFCVDTMPFTEWLQFIFVPKMKEVIEQGCWLPSSGDISIMAEESFYTYPVNTNNLLNLLIECDEILMGG